MELLNLSCKSCQQHWISTSTIDNATCPRCHEGKKIEGWIMGTRDMDKVYQQDMKKLRRTHDGQQN